MPKSLIKRVSESKLILFLLLIFGLGFFLRVYRIDSLLGFYYDQGRDALIIQEFLQRGKLFLIGPATGGIEGFFRGPWYYWLITPFYFLGKGNPVCPAVFLVLTVVFSLFLLYKLGEKLSGEGTGLIALLIGSFSYYLVNASRWLSNPTPMFLVSVLLVYSLFLILEGKKLAWLLLAFLLGMGMQFGGLAELFYFPAVLVFAIWQRKNFPGFKILILSFFLLCLVFAPQVFFDIRHQGILSTAIKKFLFEKESFRISFWVVLKVRTVFYFNLFASKIFPFNKILSGVTFVVVFLNAWRKRKEIFSNKYFVTLSLLLGAPLIGMVFFQGNYGNVYDYYFTGYYLIFVLFFSYLIVILGKSYLGKFLVVIFLAAFLLSNIHPLIKDYSLSLDDPKAIVLANEKEAIDWIYSDFVDNESGKKDFNVDVYVPPVIPFAYDYLFAWYGKGRYGKEPVEKIEPVLYTLYELDPEHPERLKAWLDRQAGIGKVLKNERFGGIVVQRRERLK